jgi:ABC-type sugar transport system substrate-binding protein
MPEPVKLVASFLTKENEFQLLQADDAAKAAARAGVEIEIVFADNNPVEQIQQLFKYVHAPREARPRAIVVETVSGEGLERVARNAVQAGIGWVLMNRTVAYLDELRSRFPKLPIATVTTDQVEIGRIQARQFRLFLPGGGSVLYLQGPSDTSVARERLQGMQEALADTRIAVSILEGRWTEESGAKAVQAWLRLKTFESAAVDVVGCQNDAMAMGARRVLHAHPDQPARPWTDVPFTGVDGVPDVGQRLVQEGKLAATIVTPSNGGPAVDLVTGWLRSGVAPPAQLVLPAVPFPADSELAARWAARPRSSAV